MKYVRLAELIRDNIDEAWSLPSIADGRLFPEQRPEAPPPGNLLHAAQLLHHVLDGDYLGRGPDGEVYLLLKLDDWIFGRLCRWGADVEDDEANGDHEPSVGDDDREMGADDEGEPSLVTALGNNVQVHPDYQRAADRDGEESSYGPSPDTVIAARRRWRKRGRPRLTPEASIPRHQRRRWQMLVGRAGR